MTELLKNEELIESLRQSHPDAEKLASATLPQF
jgi:hypothetical protein